MKEYCISYTGTIDNDLYYGATFRFITADTYYDSVDLFGMGELYNNNIGYYLNKASDNHIDEDSGYTFDFGLLMNIGDIGIIGFTAKNLKKIDFESENINLTLKPQYRIGFTLSLSQSSFVTIDKDLTKNETLVKDSKSQKLSIGLQTSFFDDSFILRAGGRRDSKVRDSEWRYFIGTGIRIADYMNIQGAFHYRPGNDSFSMAWGMNLFL